MRGHIVAIGCVGVIESHLPDRLLAHGRTVADMDSFEDAYPPALKEANLELACGSDCFALIKANLLATAADGRRAEILRIAAGVRKVIRSSSSVHGDQLASFGDVYVALTGRPVVVCVQREDWRSQVSSLRCAMPKRTLAESR